MSDSLLYCMNGNRPPELSSPEMRAIQSDVMLHSKRPLKRYIEEDPLSNYGIGACQSVVNAAQKPNKIIKFCNELNDDTEPGQTSL